MVCKDFCLFCELRYYGVSLLSRFNKLKYEKVRPLKEKVDLTGEELREAEGKMVSLESRRGELEQRLRELAKNYEKATVDKNNQQEATVNMDQQVTALSDYSPKSIFPSNLKPMNPTPSPPLPSLAKQLTPPPKFILLL